jgi:hypothetical protein
MQRWAPVLERILAEFILFSPLLQLKHPCELHRHIPSKDALGRTAAYQGASFFLSRSNTGMAGSCEWIEMAAMRELAMNFESFGRKRRYPLRPRSRQRDSTAPHQSANFHNAFCLPIEPAA